MNRLWAMISTFFILAASTVMAAPVYAAVVEQTIEYKQGDTVLEGFLAYDDASEVKRPGVLVIHEWTGLGDYAKSRARQLASMGYIAFAADIYGKGVRPVEMKDCAAEAGKYKENRPLFRLRALQALEVLQNHPLTDTSRIAAIGYCFGGTGVLELARSGADIKGVVSFHGGLSSPTPADATNIKAKVLALHGANDPYVDSQEVMGFAQEMSAANVDWQLVAYGNTVHSFTNPGAGSDNSKGAAYNASSDKRSWQAMKVFLNEIFA